MGDAGDRIACRLDHHLHVLARHRLGDVRRQAHRGDARRIPAEIGEPRRHAFGAKIGDRPHRNAGHMRHLREKHGAEFTRPDKGDADRSGLFGAAPREVVQVHARFFPSAAFALAKATLRQ